MECHFCGKDILKNEIRAFRDGAFFVCNDCDLSRHLASIKIIFGLSELQEQNSKEILIPLFKKLDELQLFLEPIDYESMTLERIKEEILNLRQNLFEILFNLFNSYAERFSR